MGVEKIISMLTQIIEFWRKQNILISPKAKQEIDKIQKNNFLELPYDFIEFYSRVNGMEALYPNEIDDEGFLFYPIEAVIRVSNEFNNSSLVNKDKIFIFAEYMHKSWWYGIEMTNDKDYVIGIIHDEDSFKPIVNSLADFIKLYIENSPRLYDYS